VSQINEGTSAVGTFTASDGGYGRGDLRGGGRAPARRMTSVCTVKGEEPRSSDKGGKNHWQRVRRGKSREDANEILEESIAGTNSSQQETESLRNEEGEKHYRGPRNVETIFLQGDSKFRQNKRIPPLLRTGKGGPHPRKRKEILTGSNCKVIRGI